MRVAYFGNVFFVDTSFLSEGGPFFYGFDNFFEEATTASAWEEGTFVKGFENSQAESGLWRNR